METAINSSFNYDDTIQSLCRPGYANDLLRGVVNIPIYSKEKYLKSLNIEWSLRPFYKMFIFLFWFNNYI